MLFESSIGPCGIAWNDAGLTALQLPEERQETTRARLLAKAKEGGAMATATTAPGWVRDAIARVREHLGGKAQDLTRIPLDTSTLTPFRVTVLRAAQTVAAGRTATYGDLANMAGSPRASRAVGRAMATNPWPIIVPCHRVVAAAGGAGGFSAYGGVVTKEKILQIEGATLITGAAGNHELPFHAPKRPRRLAFDPDAAVRALTTADSILGKHIAKIGPFRLEIKETEGTFAALAEAIVYQQLSGRAAATIFGRVCALYPNGRLDPKRLLRSSDEELRGAGLSAAKLASLRDLAAKTISGAIPTVAELDAMDDEAIVKCLTDVRGIGRWTVEMLLMFRLGRPDVLPVADYGIKKGFARLFPKGRSKYPPDELPTALALTTRGERWRPFRSVASWYLWRAADT